jgi:hypothetical protein
VSLFLALILFALVDGGRALALSVRLTLEEMVLKADLVVRAHVVQVTGDWLDVQRRTIETTNVLEVVYPIKGQPIGTLLTVKTQGGTVGNLTMVVEDEPIFRPGEEVIVFLGRPPSVPPASGGDEGRGGLTVFGAGQGKFSVEAGQVVNHAWLMRVPVGDFLDQVEQALLKQGITPTMPSRAARQAIEAHPSLTGRGEGERGGGADTILSSLRLDGLWRTLTGGPVPDNYVYNGMKWPGANPMDEVYVVNLNAADVGPGNGSATDFLNAIVEAGRTWNRVQDAHFDFVYGGSTTVSAKQYDNVNAVFWVNMGAVSTLARASWWYSGDQILEADVEINEYWTWDATGSPGSNEVDLQSVALHELGHWLSLGHDTDSSCSSNFTTSPVMCPAYALGKLKRNLHSNDIAGITYIYPGPTDTPSAVPPTNTPTQTPTNTPTQTPTNTPTQTPTNTPTPTPTNTPTHTPTHTPTNTPTHTPTQTPTNTLTSTPTNTSTHTPTSTPTLTPTPLTTIEVVNSQDDGPGSLRQAIRQANATVGPNTITFNIPPADPGFDDTRGVWTIHLASTLPSLDDLSGGTTIAGGTQPDPGNNPTGPRLVLDGPGTTGSTGLIVQSAHNVVRSLAIGGFGAGVRITGPSASDNVVTGNVIGAGIDGGLVPNLGDGIHVSDGAYHNVFGPNNVLALNGGDGVAIYGGASLDNTVTRNQVYGNAGRGIRLAEGGNAGLAAPQVTSNNGQVSGYTCSLCNVELFFDSADQGEAFVIAVQADNQGNFSTTLIGSQSLPFVTTTATDPTGNTSPFSYVALQAVGNVDPITGGSLVPPGNSISLVFPAGAVSNTTLVTYTTRPQPTPAPGGFQFLGKSFILEATDLAGNPVTQFDQPYTLTLHYSDSDLEATGVWPEASLNLYFWDGVMWQPVLPCSGCSLDLDTNTLVAVLNHLTDFAVLGCTLPADIDQDREVGVADLQQLADRWRHGFLNDATYHFRFDLDDDGTTTTHDVQQAATAWGQRCLSP